MVTICDYVKTSLFKENSCGYFKATFGKTWATFNLVTLVRPSTVLLLLLAMACQTFETLEFIVLNLLLLLLLLLVVIVIVMGTSSPQNLRTNIFREN